MSPTGQQWMERLGGDSQAKEPALAELRQLLLQRLQNSFRDRPDLSSDFVEDVAQDSLIKVLNKLDTFEGRSEFTTWATTIAIRTAFSELRKKHWKNVSLDQVLAGGNDPASPHVEVDSAGEKTGLIGAMYEVIHERLTVKQRDALLAELNGMPLEEIARRTESSRNAVYKLTHDARKRLKRNLEERGYTREDWHSMKS